jgi:hypothetical protein
MPQPKAAFPSFPKPHFGERGGNRGDRCCLSPIPLLNSRH